MYYSYHLSSSWPSKWLFWNILPCQNSGSNLCFSTVTWSEHHRFQDFPVLILGNHYDSQSTSLQTILHYLLHPSWVHMPSYAPSFCTLVINVLGFYPNTSVRAWENVLWNARTHGFSYPHKPHKGRFRTPFSFVLCPEYCFACHVIQQVSPLYNQRLPPYSQTRSPTASPVQHNTKHSSLQPCQLM